MFDISKEVTKVNMEQVTWRGHHNVVIVSVPNTLHIKMWWTLPQLTGHTKTYVATEYPAQDLINLLMAALRRSGSFSPNWL